MDVLHLIGIILAASLLESLFSVLFVRRSEDTSEIDFDLETEARYSRLGSEYEDVSV